MSDVIRKRSELLSDYADQHTQSITPQNDRNFVISVLGCLPQQAKTADYLLTLDDGAVFCSAASGNISLTLPAAATTAGRLFAAVKTDAGANYVQLTATVSGIVNYQLKNQYDFVFFISDGTSYYFIKDSDAFHKSASAEISALAQKTAPAASDNILIEDGAAANVKKRVAVSDIFKGDVTVPVNTASALGRIHTYGTDAGAGNIQANDVVVDGVSGGDKGVSFREAGVLEWENYIYRGESGEFLYWWNDLAQIDAMVMSRGGRLALNKPSNLVDPYATFTGAGANDMSVDSSSSYTDAVQGVFQIKINANGSPDTFQWRKSYDGGATWLPDYAGSLNCSTSAVLVADGVYVKFTSATGHTIGDVWQFTVFAQLPQGTMTINPRRLYSQNYNGSIYTDITYRMNSKQTPASQYSAILHQGATDGFLYVGAASVFNSMWMSLSSAAVGVTLKAEYSIAGSGWTQLSLATNNFFDSTAALTADGKIRWDKSSMPTWAPQTINGISAYWIRISSTSTVTTAATAKMITAHGQYRFGVYSGFYDTNPSFFIDASGRASFDTGVVVNKFDNDTALGGAAPSDLIVPTQKAVAQYAASGLPIAIAAKQFLL